MHPLINEIDMTHLTGKLIVDIQDCLPPTVGMYDVVMNGSTFGKGLWCITPSGSGHFDVMRGGKVTHWIYPTPFVKSIQAQQVQVKKDTKRRLFAPRKNNSPLTIEQIVQYCSGYFNLPVNHIKSKSRIRDLVKVRTACMYMMRKFEFSLVQIAECFNRDHTTVIAAIDNSAGWRANDVDSLIAFKSEVDKLHKNSYIIKHKKAS